MGDLVLGNLNQLSVAGRAPRDGSEMSRQMETANDLGHLFPRVGCPHVAAVGDRAMFEKAHVPGEEDAVFGGRDPHELRIVPVALVERVEAEESEEPRQPTQVVVGDEPHRPKRLRPHLDDRCDVE